MIAMGLLLFVLIHFFYDPYRIIETLASSQERCELQAGDPEVLLAVVSDGKPGIDYRVAARVEWDSVVEGIPDYKRARVIFASYDSKGQWIRSPHGVCGVIGSGQDHFESVLPIPEGAATTRLVFQHLGKAGSFRLDEFSLEQVEFKRSAPVIFRGLQFLWIVVAIYVVWYFRLLNRFAGVAVILVAGLIAVGMLLPGAVLKEVRTDVDDFLRPEMIASAPSSSSTGTREVAIEHDTPARGLEDIRSERIYIADWFRHLDLNTLGHAGLFLLFGLVCGVYFNVGSNTWFYILRIFAGGVVFALSAELLQVTELTRSVRISDIGVNILGWLTGLLAVTLVFRVRSNSILTEGKGC